MISGAFWNGQRVLLTGHTGFKGAWMAMLLRRLGAQTYGLALPPSAGDSLFVAAGVEQDLTHSLGDIRDVTVVRNAFAAARPHIVIHMAAQSLVRASYTDPIGTFATNIMGTAHVLDCARTSPELRTVLIVTSDKCYENIDRTHAFREGDRLGGHDPYSASKACAELVTGAYRRSFVELQHRPRLASARAGNVIGGGDWAADRLVPDAIRAFRSGSPLMIRNPEAVRPWQHVLDPVVAYLMLTEQLATDAEFAEAWNFGPDRESELSVAQVADLLAQRWGDGARWTADRGEHPHEAQFLKLDSSKARQRLGWHPLLDLRQALDLTVDWYKGLLKGTDIRTLSWRQIDNVMERCGITL